ncbi:MAG: TlpA family protein disulfide reductase [Thermoplasmata archaeon]
MKTENLERHLRKVHPGEEVDTHISKEQRKKIRTKTRRGVSRREGVVFAASVLAIAIIVVLAFVYKGPRESMVGQEAPGFTVEDVISRTRYTLPTSFYGELVFVEFFSTTCKYCIDFIPTMEQLYQTYSVDVNFVSIDIKKDDTVEDLIDFVGEHPGSDWIHSLDISDAASAYKIRGTPQLFIIDLVEDPSKGIVKYDHGGIASYNEIASVFNELLSQ